MTIIAINLEDVRRTAQRELHDEFFKAAVAKEVARLKAYRPWYRRLFPWRIIIMRVS